jgi:hypothetical protein
MALSTPYNDVGASTGLRTQVAAPVVHLVSSWPILHLRVAVPRRSHYHVSTIDLTRCTLVSAWFADTSSVIKETMDEEGACIGEEAEEVVAQADKEIAQPSAFDSQAVRDLFGDAAFQKDSEAFDFASSDGSISLDGVSPAREQSRKTVSKNLDAFFPSVKALPAGTTWAKARKLDDIMMATLLCAAFCSDRFWLGFAHWLAYTLVSVKGSLLAASTLTNYFGTAMSLRTRLS